MKLFIPTPGTTFHVPKTGPKHDPDRGHLLIILTPTDKNGFNLLVPVSSWQKTSDTTCILGKGDHKFINRKSVVLYNDIALYNSDELGARVNDGEVKYKGLIDMKLLARICAGVQLSKLTPKKYQKYFQENTPKL